MAPETPVLDQRKLMRYYSERAYRDALKALPKDMSALSRDEAAGVFRKIATGVVDRYKYPAEVSGRSSYLAIRANAAPGASELGLSVIGEAVPPLPTNRIDDVVAGAMERFVKGDFDTAKAVFGQKTASTVVDIHRDTALSLAAVDPANKGMVRSASALACAFCQSVDGARVYSIDAMELHDNCTCVVEPEF